jgi:nucleoside-diphosphate-sugar epimerase
MMVLPQPLPPLHNYIKDCTTTASMSKILVVGATGGTGKHVVQQLLDQGQSVVAVARSKEKLTGWLQKKPDDDRLQVEEVSILDDWTEDEFKEHTKDCAAVVSCLGHTQSIQGIWGPPYRLVTEATKRLTTAMPDGAKFILMGSEGVADPKDPERPLTDSAALFLMRYLVPPHADNEAAVDYLQQHPEVNWVVIRPTNLIDDDQTPPGEYALLDHPRGDLFGYDAVSRSNVAHFMVELITNEKTWEQYKHKMPVMKPNAKVKNENQESK